MDVHQRAENLEITVGRIHLYQGSQFQGNDGDIPEWISTGPCLCNGRCLLTAANAQVAETFVWSLSPYAPTPTPIAGQLFLDAGKAALDATGEPALLLSAQGLRRITLPPGAETDGQLMRASVSGARLSIDARHAFVLDEDSGWRIYEASDMSPVPEPDWLDDEQHMAAIAPDGGHAGRIGASPSPGRAGSVDVSFSRQVTWS